MNGKWTVQKAESFENTSFLLAFLLEEFSRIFGKNIMFNEDCIIFNDPKADCPMLIINDAPVHIRLTQDSPFYFPQTIYQLSHEMCHYAIRQGKEDKDFTLSWFEEIICEAVSLYALEYASREWQKCILAQSQPYWGQLYSQYLTNELSKSYSNDFEKCDTIEKLRCYEAQRISESQRETHRAERNYVYRVITQNPLELKCILNYTQYIENNGVTINFDKWIQDNPWEFLNKLKKIQPVKFYAGAIPA